MIELAELLKFNLHEKLFTSLVKDFNVNFHYGDQKELNTWIALMNENSKIKYPLIWFVLKEPTDIKGSVYKFDVDFILMQSTERNYLNNKRFSNIYEPILIPLDKWLHKNLQNIKGINLIGYKGESNSIDEPNFGVNRNYEGQQSDFGNESEKGKKSINTDRVDARIIKVSFFYQKLKC